MINTSELTIQGLSSTEARRFENGHNWFSHNTRTGKLLAQYELYKSISGLPGDVLEFGVFKAASLLRFAMFRRFLENDHSRRIIGFDAFGVFPRSGINHTEDVKFIDAFEVMAGNGLQEEELKSLLALRGIENVNLVGGNVFDTLDPFLATNPHLRIALLHLDMDVAAPTEFVLRRLFDRLVPGGIVMIDDYNSVAGATEVVDAFVAERSLEISKLPYYYVPSFIRK
jgi:hypothetical protein